MQPGVVRHSQLSGLIGILLTVIIATPDWSAFKKREGEEEGGRGPRYTEDRPRSTEATEGMTLVRLVI